MPYAEIDEHTTFPNGKTLVLYCDRGMNVTFFREDASLHFAPSMGQQALLPLAPHLPPLFTTFYHLHAHSITQPGKKQGEHIFFRNIKRIEK